MLDVSVIICTHNPRADYLARVLDGLRNQTLPLEKWELLIVDNGSRTPVAAAFDLSWHPAGRHVVESKLGLTWARLRGINTASADLIVFVDDDNVLDQAYLAEAIKIMQNWPSLGVWGSGRIRGDFELELPASLQKYRSLLSLRDQAVGSHSHKMTCDGAPIGAGLCVVKVIALAYLQYVSHSTLCIVGRHGTDLLGGEDFEISYLCCNYGREVGVFPQLQIRHLISPDRCSSDYFIRLMEGGSFSRFLVEYKWTRALPQSTLGIKTLLSVLKTFLLCRGVDRKMRWAWLRALLKANRTIAQELHKSGAMNDGRIASPSSKPATAEWKSF